jgi:hypothetical protein
MWKLIGVKKVCEWAQNNPSFLVINIFLFEKELSLRLVINNR